MTLTIDPRTSLGDLVAERPARAVVLEQHGLDYCCGGRRSLADACARAGVDVDVVAARLAAVADERPGWQGGTITDLVDHIEATHHEFLHEVLPTLEPLAQKVLGVHGERHPELAEVARLLGALVADMGPHLMKEERVLFPACRVLDAATAPVALPFGTVTNPVRVMETDHEAVGGLLAALRSVTGGYEPPADACTSYRRLYERLAGIEADTHTHIHLENNVLHPKVQAKERALQSGG